MEKCRSWKISKTPFHTDFTLINVNNLRAAIDLAKRVMTKEKIKQTADWTILHPIHESDQL